MICNQKTKDMNRVKSFVWVLWLLCAAVLYPGCSREVISSPDSSAETDGGRTEAGSLRIVIRTPSPDDVINPGSRADVAGEETDGDVPETVLHEKQEWTVKKLGVYIFMASSQSASDANYRLVKKTENITFGETGVPGESGTDLGNGEYSYTEPLSQEMLGNFLKVLLVANEGTELGTADINGISGTTLDAFKRLTATAVLADEPGQRADVISGGVYTGETDLTGDTYTGIVMSGVAKKGESEEIHLAAASSLELDALLTRNVARIDIRLNKQKLKLKNAVLKTTWKQAYLFPQDPFSVPSDGLTTNSLLPVSQYAEVLGDDKAGFSYQVPESDTEPEEVTRDRNTLKHVFYLYEQANIAEENSATIEVTYTLPDANGVEQEGVLSIPFKTVTAEGTESYVNTVRNHLYTVVLGDGTLDGKVVFRIDVDDWEPNEIHEFLPGDDSEAVPEP